MVYDCFQFFNELDLLKLRLNVLSEHVDKFVLVESTVTFSGERKPLYYLENKCQFLEFQDRIIHIVVEDTPNTKNTSAFDRDAFQKKARERGILNAPENALIIFSDLDEIPNPKELQNIKNNFDSNKVYHFAQRQFYFYLNNEECSGKLLSFAGDFVNVKNKKWLGSYLFSKSLLKKMSIEEIRVMKDPNYAIRIEDGGWHFTYMGGGKHSSVIERVRHKIQSAAHQEFNTPKILLRLSSKIKNQKDIFGRKAKFKMIEIDESYPQYLLNHLDDYDYLILKETKKGFAQKVLEIFI